MQANLEQALKRKALESACWLSMIKSENQNATEIQLDLKQFRSTMVWDHINCAINRRLPSMVSLRRLPSILLLFKFKAAKPLFQKAHFSLPHLLSLLPLNVLPELKSWKNPETSLRSLECLKMFNKLEACSEQNSMDWPLERISLPV